MSEKRFDDPAVFEIGSERFVFADCRRVVDLHAADDRADELWKVPDGRYAYVKSWVKSGQRWYEASWVSEARAIEFAEQCGVDRDDVLWEMPASG